MKIHQQELSKIGDYQIIKRFAGGMSNYTYLISDSDENKYVYRYPGEGNELFVDPKELAGKLKEINKFDITNKCLYYNEDNGQKISTYIPGKNINDDVNLQDVADVLKSVHNSNVNFPKYDHLGRLDKYENIHMEENEEYIFLKKKWMEIYDNVLNKFILFPTHGDAQFANLLEDEFGNIKIIDWEFSGVNDYIYDIACFGNIDFDYAIKLINVYEDKVSNEHLIRLYGWRIFQCLQWYNVAKIKHQKGLSDKLNIDFENVSQGYIDKAQIFFDELESIKT